MRESRIFLTGRSWGCITVLSIHIHIPGYSWIKNACAPLHLEQWQMYKTTALELLSLLAKIKSKTQAIKSTCMHVSSTFSKHGQLACPGSILYILSWSYNKKEHCGCWQSLTGDRYWLRDITQEGTELVHTSPVRVRPTRWCWPLSPLRSRLAEFEDTSTLFLMSKVHSS